MVLPMPVGSELSRRAIWLTSGTHAAAWGGGGGGPPPRLPAQRLWGLVGSTGGRAGWQEGRLCITRRLAGHAQAQPRVLPSPVGAELSRRANWLPAGPHAPA